VSRVLRDRAWPYAPWLGSLVRVGLPGRGREAISGLSSSDEIVRHYDGASNPIGRAYDRETFRRLLAPLEVREFFYHLFPMRALGVSLPRPLHRSIQQALPFMIVANARKP
jgi:hypothetical protein